VIVGARNELLFDAQGREYIDLCAGYGSVWLGHNHPGVQRALEHQLRRYAAPGYLPFEALEQARAALSQFIPPGHFVGGIYSTGMEAMETALRAAWAQTGRLEVAGFAGATHGRSFLTAAIGAGEPDALRPFVHSLPDVAALARLAERVRLAAIVVEPVHMSGAGRELGAEACAQLFALAAAHRAAVIFDETLTGLYRCGARSYAEAMGVSPDIVVLGKGLANGFPAAAVALRRGFAWDREKVRPGSTYWNHPLACAAIAATLQELARAGASEKVERIASVIRAELGHLVLRGRGAMWCLESPQAGRQQAFAEAIQRAGVVVSYYDRYIRLLPPLALGSETGAETLARACKAIAAAHADTFG